MECIRKITTETTYPIVSSDLAVAVWDRWKLDWVPEPVPSSVSSSSSSLGSIRDTPSPKFPITTRLTTLTMRAIYLKPSSSLEVVLSLVEVEKFSDELFSTGGDIFGCHGGSGDAAVHLDLGREMLSKGNLLEALSHFDIAVDKDPSNYLTYFRRATALTQRGSVYLKQGHLDKASRDFEEIVHYDPNNAEAVGYLHQIAPLGEEIQHAKILYNNHDFQGAIILLSKAIDLCPWDPELREIRAECYIAQGDLFKAVGDIRPTTKLRNDNTPAFFKLANLYYEMGDADESLSQIRECLKLDPDHKECFPFYKKVKKLAKQLKEAQDLSNAESWDDCVAKAKAIMKTEPKGFPFVQRAKSHICHCLAKAGHGSDAIKACNEVLEMEPENLHAMCDRAEAPQWHPDKFQEEDEKKHAEKVFMDIAAAKEVLSDPVCILN
ncbi:DNJC3-like protein [Mya arenaria]|uniref:DNJC3-like protein n=1 Tax=Mya arenaria TaxID=6604 RepID=A0ABY7G789_MYAAR|nr:DNJC3-like protein [Mya arenaria]